MTLGLFIHLSIFLFAVQIVRICSSVFLDFFHEVRELQSKQSAGAQF